MLKFEEVLSNEDHQKGNPAATLILVEYGDYQCPHCRIAHPYINRLLKRFEDDLKFIFRNFPLQEIHPVAMLAAQAAEAADKGGRFWEMHDAIYEHQDELSHDLLFRFAKDFNLDIRQFMTDYISKEVLEKVERDFEKGLRSGVNGTPTFFLNGERINDYNETYQSLERAVVNHLSHLNH